MSDIVDSNDFENKKRQLIIKKLKQIPDKENVVSVFVEDFKDQMLKELKEDISESVKELWFPSEDVRINLEKITADCRDTDYWASILQKYKDGKVEEKDLIDYIVLSHVTVNTNEINPIEVLDRQIETGLKSRVGVKYIKRLIDTTNKVMQTNLTALGEYLALESPPEIKLLTSPTSESTEQIKALIPLNPEVQLALQATDTIFTNKDEEDIVREFFAGDIIYDKLIDLSYLELVDKLADPDDYEFDSTRTLIIDAGMEQQDKALKREAYENDPSKLRFSLYIVWLSNIFDGFGGTHSDDRGVYKYRIPTPITEIEFMTLMQMIKNRYDKYVEGRIEFSQLRMEWKTHKELNAKIASPYSALTPYDKDVLLKETINSFASVTNELSLDAATENIRNIFKEMNLI